MRFAYKETISDKNEAEENKRIMSDIVTGLALELSGRPVVSSVGARRLPIGRKLSPRSRALALWRFPALVLSHVDLLRPRF